jgi:uncharacterized damage-inducible protein DinB
MHVRHIVVTLSLIALPFPMYAQNAPRQGRIRGYRAEVLANLNEVQDKIMQLAEAVPAAKYAWRPAKGVRSISEVFMHIAGGNYFLATFLGRTPPPDIPKDLEKISEKQRVVSELRRSFDYLRHVIANEPDANLEKTVKMFGATTTHRAVLMTMLNHLHEHLGQAIAYARSNGVVPPWSR